MRDLRGYESPTSINRPHPTAGETATSSEEDTARNETATPFTPAELALAWDDFAETLKNQYPHLYSTLKNSRPALLEDWNISFTIDNKVLEEELTSHKTEMMEFLRTRLNNFRIRLQTNIAEVQKTRKPYTDREKFDLMAEKNPNLRKLRETLDLDIEY
jgi:DNA polymerase-3 subunit gamma/tau